MFVRPLNPYSSGVTARCCKSLGIVHISEISFFFGVSTLICASIFLDDFRSYYELHQKYPSLCNLTERERARCTEIKWWIAIASAGIVVSSCQIVLQALYAVEFLHNQKVWCYIQAIFGLLCSAISMLAFFKEVHKFGEQTGKFYTWQLILNVAFSCCIYLLIRKDDSRVSNIDVESGRERTFESISPRSFIFGIIGRVILKPIQVLQFFLRTHRKTKNQSVTIITENEIPIFPIGKRFSTLQPTAIPYDSNEIIKNKIVPKMDFTKKFCVHGSSTLDLSRMVNVYVNPPEEIDNSVFSESFQFKAPRLNVNQQTWSKKEQSTSRHCLPIPKKVKSEEKAQHKETLLFTRNHHFKSNGSTMVVEKVKRDRNKHQGSIPTTQKTQIASIHQTENTNSMKVKSSFSRRKSKHGESRKHIKSSKVAVLFSTEKSKIEFAEESETETKYAAPHVNENITLKLNTSKCSIRVQPSIPLSN